MTQAELLLTEFSHAGIQLLPRDERVLCRPKSALTPDLMERLRTHKREVLEILRAQTVSWEDCIEPDPCPGCGAIMCWWNALGDQRCMACDPPT